MTPLRAGTAATALFAVAWVGITAAIGGGGLVAVFGWALLYVVGLGWVVYAVERAAVRIETRAAISRQIAPEGGWLPTVSISGELRGRKRTWNPLDPAAWYYFRSRPRLVQSLGLFIAYSLFFVAAYFLAHWRYAGDHEGFDLPAGGGSDSIQASSVKVQKVIRKKYVINPYSSIVFAAPPPIDKVDTQLTEDTQNRYQVGQGSGGTGDGDGDGAGFGGGTGKGKASFVRLRHGDRGWDRNFGIGGDRNMLAEYAARTKQKIADETEYVDAGQLPRMPTQKNPPLLYVCGNGSVPLTATDKKILRQYLLERHGMILGDNHGGPGFQQHFVAVMNEVTGVSPVAIPRDDRIHQRPYALPQLPVVVAHGGTVPLGWKLDGRWAVYLHPGALSDAWRDDHAGIKKDVYESCYQLGVNVIFYSLQEKNKWLMSQKQ